MSRFTDPEQRDPTDSSAWYTSPRPSPRSHWLAVVAIVALFIVALALLAHAS